MNKLISLIIIFHLWHHLVIAQGCSDAGICTIGTHQITTSHDSTQTTKTVSHRDWRVTTSVASGEQKSWVVQVIPELNLPLGKRLHWQVKVPMMLITGNLGTTQGIGDITSGFSYITRQSKQGQFTFIAGTKLPVNQANITQNGRALPMPYQTSLGTYDLIGGIAWQQHNWIAAVGYQHILHHQNQNGFLRTNWLENNDAQKYFQSYHLRRGADASLRIERRFQLKELICSAGLLGIYRLAYDEILDPVTQSYTALPSSKGLTLNVNLHAVYTFKNGTRMGAQAGVPVAVRSVRADGLTRSAILNLTFIQPF